MAFLLHGQENNTFQHGTFSAVKGDGHGLLYWNALYVSFNDLGAFGISLYKKKTRRVGDQTLVPKSGPCEPDSITPYICCHPLQLLSIEGSIQTS